MDAALKHLQKLKRENHAQSEDVKYLRPDGSSRSSSFGGVCGARDDSPSWNLGRAKQGDTIRVDGTSQRGRGQEDVKESERGGCFRVQQGQVQGQAVERGA